LMLAGFRISWFGEPMLKQLAVAGRWMKLLRCSLILSRD